MSIRYAKVIALLRSRFAVICVLKWLALVLDSVVDSLVE